MDSIYQYTPLPSEGAHIRLILLQPGSSREDINFHLITVSFTALPEFEALSYTWGSSDQPLARSAVDGKYTIHITSSLALALRHLREKERERTLWVDAICINQTDNAEKAIQVNFMGEIYSKATKVVVWVGTEENNSQCAIQFIEEISKRRRLYKRKKFAETQSETYERLKMEKKNDEAPEESEETDASDDDPEVLDRFGRPIYFRHVWLAEDYYRFFNEEREGDWTALDTFLRRAWFSRAWVVQEVWRASKVAIRCGHTFLDWSVFRNAMQYIQTWDEWKVDRSSHHLTMGSLEGLKRRYSLALHISKPRVGGRLMSLLFNTWDLAATDPRDKVFSMLGLANLHVKNSLQVDYTKPIHDVYKECAAFIIQDENSLEILYGGSGLNCEVGLPSWVPDWRREALQNRPALFVNRTKTFTIFSAGSSLNYGTKDFPYRASGNSKPAFLFPSNLDILRVSCKMIDVIERVESGPTTGLDLWARHQSARELVTHRENMSSEDKLKSQDIQEQVWNVLVAGNSEEEEVENLEEVVQNVMTHRRFFITESGLFGVGPETIEAGHIACVIAGCSLPYIVCKEEEHYLLVGEAFGKLNSFHFGVKGKVGCGC